MSVIKNIKVRKTLVWTLKLVLFIIVLYFFIVQISRIEYDQLKSLHVERPFYFLLVIFLLPINWGLEMLKWQKVLYLNSIKYSLKELTHSFFSGVTTGIVTPNRIGNFIGRMIFFKGKVRGQLILGTLYSNFAQFLVTLIFGSIGIITISNSYQSSVTTSMIVLFSILLSLSALFYFLVPFIPLEKIKFLNRKLNLLIEFQEQSKDLYFTLLRLSSLRYLVFSLQFLLVLMSFGVNFSFTLYAAILLLFLVSTLTPSLLFGKLFIRETAGLIILGLFVDNTATIIASSLLLWIINLGIPSLFGLFFIFKNKRLANA